MSADNYYLIREVKGRYVVTCEFASDQKPGSFDGGKWFDSKGDAEAWADDQYSEYGVRFEQLAKADAQAIDANAGPCSCRLCQRSRNLREIIARRDVDELISTLNAFADYLWRTEEDASYYRGIVDGTWPNAVAILERSLEKAKLKAVAEVC